MTRRLIGSLFTVAMLLACAMVPAAAQVGNTTGLVLTTCGSPTVAFKAGNPGPFTVDVNGNLCISTTLPTGGATAANQTSTQAPATPGAATATKSTLAGCQGTSGNSPFTNGQQGAVSCDLVGNLLVSSGGAANLATGQVSVLTTSTPTVTARAGRRAVTVTNITGSQPLFCTSGTATLVNGQLIAGTVGANFTFPYAGALNCIATTTAQTVSVAETY